jgi:hypothetical protein
MTTIRGSQSGLSLTDLGPDLLESVLVHLDAGEFFEVATTCRAFAELCRLPVLWTWLPLGPSEDAAFPLERRHLLERLVEAGNPAANYRLGVALSPLCDRQTDMDVAQSQVGFFKFICMPFYSVVADLVDPNMLPWLRVQANLQTWKLDGGALQRKLRATGQAAVLTRSMTMDVRSSHSLKKRTGGPPS